ncbi:hypothetical protein [Vibrio coralliilyticus]|nr:hypothetical protein [Vibrio coralliilyticus]
MSESKHESAVALIELAARQADKEQADKEQADKEQADKDTE